jgi:hypothetical protein
MSVSHAMHCLLVLRLRVDFNTHDLRSSKSICQPASLPHPLPARMHVRLHVRLPACLQPISPMRRSHGVHWRLKGRTSKQQRAKSGLQATQWRTRKKIHR